MKLRTHTRMQLQVDQATPMMLILRPRSGYGQWVHATRFDLRPFVETIEFTDAYGNLCQRLVAPQGEFEVEVETEVTVADQIDTAPGAFQTYADQLPDYTLPLTLPSRYCESDELGAVALDVVSGHAPGWDQVEAIRAWIQKNFEYKYGASDATTSAAETIEQKQGVCRDFSHVGIALCRALNVPARIVVGYLHKLEPMDQHAWFEAFVNGRWYTFDATQGEPRGGRVVVAYGRDAADVALISQWGPATMKGMTVSVEAI